MPQPPLFAYTKVINKTIIEPLVISLTSNTLKIMEKMRSALLCGVGAVRLDMYRCAAVAGRRWGIILRLRPPPRLPNTAPTRQGAGGGILRVE